METEIQIFKDFIRKRGMRYTPERDRIAREVLGSDDHFDVDELFIRLKKKVGISKASIYRTIPLLVEAGLIAEVYLENGHMHYERVHGRTHHCHLRCVYCRKTVEFSDERLQEIEREVALRFGFATNGHKMVVTGICPDCLINH